MLKHVTVSNYRSLDANVAIRLGALTVLVGPNGSGKSNVADVFRFMADAMRVGLEGAITKRHGIAAVRRWSSGRPFNLSFSVELALPGGLTGVYSFALAGDKTEEYRVKSEEAIISGPTSQRRFRIEDGRWVYGPENLRPAVNPLNLVLPLVAGDSRFEPLATALKNVAVYSIFPDSLREPQKYDPATPMNEHGENWVSILKDQDEAALRGDLLEALRRLTGDIEDLRIVPVGGYLSVQFKHAVHDSKRPKWFDAAQESDGTLRVAGIVTALLQSPPLTLIGVEEPELTVHAGAIPMIFDFLKQASRHSQVIVTTHSAELLDLVDPDDVRVVERREGATTVTSMLARQKEAVRERLLSLGEIMRSEGLKQQLDLELD